MPIMDPDQPHDISLADACRFTKKYREGTLFNGLNGGFFGKKAIQDILDQEDCAGIRYYYGVDDTNNPVLILVGVTGDGFDMKDGLLAELSVPCPYVCDNTSPLIGK